ncbi:sensor histidine kinase N-terminal domain-containing protein [Marinobacter sp. G11]|uniref:histidine kinase dimerization/phospho-acceptor domain-containing protein n=1 Tax=Marinobacter sp. G11 TaxID=2903522 RepID=UPI001E3DBCC3|nr:histidine kinase dimerization/phospho-acceptor domain-containing protein [Marinobacter sp. G11]MCE0760856.1 sensor histidine kinase N-terminal domain-containing protein [Marinobacter sp. G11]
MSLQSRLIWSLGSAFLVLWLSVAALMYMHLDKQVSHTLDQRLASSATMVAGLIARQPEMLLSQRSSPLLVHPEVEGVACQIRSAAGEVLLQTSGARAQFAEQTRPGFSTRAIGGQQWRLYTLDQNGTLITTADRMSERVALANGIILVMVVPFTLALLGGLAVLWWGVRGGLRPLQALRDELRRRTPENLEPVKVKRAPAELRPVVDTLNGLFARVAETVAWEQRFANSAAHEFRTPLTGIKTHLQVAQRVEGERQHQALLNAERGVARLQSVTEQLLMLSRIDPQGKGADVGCKIEEMIADALEDLSQQERIRLPVSIPETRLAVPLALGVVALRNLLENALKYSSGPCQLTLAPFVENTGAARLQLQVSDQGGENDAHAGRAGPESHGLGLAIVEMVVSQYGGGLLSTQNASGGMDWQLRLPVKPDF